MALSSVALLLKAVEAGGAPQRERALCLFQSQLFFDRIHESRTELLLLPVHWDDRHFLAASSDLVPSMTGLKRAALLLQPSFEFLACH